MTRCRQTHEPPRPRGRVYGFPCLNDSAKDLRIMYDPFARPIIEELAVFRSTHESLAPLYGHWKQFSQAEAMEHYLSGNDPAPAWVRGLLDPCERVLEYPNEYEWMGVENV